MVDRSARRLNPSLMLPISVRRRAWRRRRHRTLRKFWPLQAPGEGRPKSLRLPHPSSLRRALGFQRECPQSLPASFLAHQGKSCPSSGRTSLTSRGTVSSRQQAGLFLPPTYGSLIFAGARHSATTRRLNRDWGWNWRVLIHQMEIEWPDPLPRCAACGLKPAALCMKAALPSQQNSRACFTAKPSRADARTTLPNESVRRGGADRRSARRRHPHRRLGFAY